MAHLSVRALSRGLLALVTLLTAWAFQPSAVYAAGPGELDRSFSCDGFRYVDFGGHTVVSNVISVNDRRLVVAGIEVTRAEKNVFAGVRPDGRLDRSFGNRGMLTLRSGAERRPAGPWRRAPDGSLLGVGRLDAGGYYLISLLADGRRNREFGRDGIVTVRLGPDADPEDLLIEPSGRALVVVWDGGDTVIQAHRASGVRDRSFGDNGRVAISGESLQMVRDDAGRLFVVGVRKNKRLVVDAFLPDARRDRSYGSNGRGSIEIPTGADELRLPLAALASDGGIVLHTDIRFGLSLDVVVAKMTAGGRPDRRFGGGDGWRRIDVGNLDVRRDVVALPDGHIILGGDVMNDAFGESPTDMYLFGLRPDGRTWRAFGDSGLVRTNLGMRRNFSGRELVVVDGKLVVGGSARDGVFVARFLLD